MVQARALFVAIALTVTVPSVAPARSYPCWMVRAYVNSHTKQELRAMEKKWGVTDEERAAHAVCFKKGKK